MTKICRFLLTLSCVVSVFLLLQGCQWWPGSNKGADESTTQSTEENTAAQAIIFEEPYPPSSAYEDASGKTADTQPAKLKKPRVAIIIDDMGHHKKLGSQLVGLDLNLTFAFLPHAPHTKELEEKAYQRGREILLHQPMQPRDAKWDPGKGALYLQSDASDIRETIHANLHLVPHAVGVNNHMGSLFTTKKESMHNTLIVIKEQQLFYIDSFTTADSTGMDEALKMGVKTNRRHIFLDNVHNKDEICKQLKKLVALAEKQGYAIGIGHPNEATLNALTNCRGHLLEKVAVVPVQELLK